MYSVDIEPINLKTREESDEWKGMQNTEALDKMCDKYKVDKSPVRYQNSVNYTPISAEREVSSQFKSPYNADLNINDVSKNSPFTSN
jgi:hypothetical protein